MTLKCLINFSSELMHTYINIVFNYIVWFTNFPNSRSRRQS
eukprot:UN09844